MQYRKRRNQSEYHRDAGERYELCSSSDTSRLTCKMEVQASLNFKGGHYTMHISVRVEQIDAINLPLQSKC